MNYAFIELLYSMLCFYSHRLGLCIYFADWYNIKAPLTTSKVTTVNKIKESVLWLAYFSCLTQLYM